MESATWAVSIFDLEPDHRYLGFDLADVLRALGRDSADSDWIVTGLEATCGDRAATFQEEVWKKDNAGGVVVLTAEELNVVAADIDQTIWGEFVAIPKGSGSDQRLGELADLDRFPSNEAEIVVMAIDSSFWTVVTKNEGDIAELRRSFRDVREVDAAEALRLGVER